MLNKPHWGEPESVGDGYGDVDGVYWGDGRHTYLSFKVRGKIRISILTATHGEPFRVYSLTR